MPGSPRRFAAAFVDGTRIRQGTLVVTDDGLRLTADAPDPDLPRLDGVVLGGFTDHHVHLMLVDDAVLDDSRLRHVIDLGAPRDWIRARADAPGRTRVSYAGPFLTAPGGYPSDRDWALPGSVRELADADAVRAAIAELAEAGASCIKIVANTIAGPVLDDTLVTALVDAARTHGLPVVAHAEGAGQAQRVVRLGATRLAHAPFTERLNDDEIAVQAASAEWISTLAIHSGRERDVALDNVRRFHVAGGMLRYGTDMGNGPSPVDLRRDEVEALRAAGVDGWDLLHALAPVDPLEPGARLLIADAPETARTAPDPLTARPLRTAHDLPLPPTRSPGA
ncbi:hypothetical protein GCM10025768_23730 [Microbacterium pseudoresistens]